MDLSNISDLAEDQQEALRVIDAEPGPFFVTGPAGTGKSYFIKRLAQTVGAHNCALTATSGIAAQNIGGCTFHRFVGGRPDNGFQVNPFVLRTRVATINMIVIDEISMLSAINFGLYLEFFQREEGREYKNIFNERIKTVFVGDLLQLPPVDDSPVFSSGYWPRLRWIPLTTCHRQSDPVFLKALHQMRMGIFSQELVDILAERRDKQPDPEKFPVILTPHIKTAEAVNTRRLHELEGTLFESEWEYTPITEHVRKARIEKNARFVKSLRVKVGSRVVLLNNADDWVNGSTGVFRDTGRVAVTIFQNNKPAGQEIQECLIVELDTGEVVRVPKAFEDFYDGNRRLEARVLQYPIQLAWALTIHKSQGMTLDSVLLDCENHFAAGQTYVGLSRVKSREGLFIRGELTGFKTDRAAVQIYKDHGF